MGKYYSEKVQRDTQYRANFLAGIEAFLSSEQRKATVAASKL